MRWLNYHHLFYFWHVAKCGSVTEACKQLRLSQPTVSAQLKSLEDMLGEKLFQRQGRYLKLTETGQIAYRYAEQIFALGSELFDLIEGKTSGRPEVLRIGICDVMPKLLVHYICDPVLDLPSAPRMVFLEDSSERLLSRLAIHEVDVVLSDCPLPPSVRVRAYNHELGSSGITFMGTEPLVKKYKRSFPECLAAAPLLLPSHAAAMRHQIDLWFSERGMSPHVVAEFQDSALMKIFAGEGRGLFPVPSVLESAVERELLLRTVGRLPEVSETFYLISLDRRIKHPAIAKMCDNAQRALFKE